MTDDQAISNEEYQAILNTLESAQSSSDAVQSSSILDSYQYLDQPYLPVLYLPGGGMKGITQQAVLCRLEELTGEPISTLFPVVEGASIGALIAGGMYTRDPENPSQPKITAQDGLDIFINVTPKLFPQHDYREAKMIAEQTLRTSMAGLTAVFNGNTVPDQPSQFIYPAEPIEEYYKELFGADAKMGDLLGSVYISAYDAYNKEAVVFHSVKTDLLYPGQDVSMTSDNDPYLWEVVRASTANNLAFPSHVVGDRVCMDGSALHESVSGAFIDKGDLPLKRIEIWGEVPAAEAANQAMTSEGAIAAGAATMFSPMQNPQDYSREDFKNVLDNMGAIGGVPGGGIGCLVDYAIEMNGLHIKAEQNTDETIVIAPRDAMHVHDLEFNEILDTSVDARLKALEYAEGTLLIRDDQIKETALHLLDNMMQRGLITDEQFLERVKNIDNDQLSASATMKAIDAHQNALNGIEQKLDIDFELTHNQIADPAKCI